MLFKESNGTGIDSAICIPSSWPARWSSLPHLTRQRLTPACRQGNITPRHGQCTMTKFSPEQDAAIATLIAAVPNMLAALKAWIADRDLPGDRRWALYVR